MVALINHLLTYIKQFLTGRTIQVQVGRELSEIKNGTPQGSVISLLLFLIMINDLPECIKGSEITLIATFGT